MNKTPFKQQFMFFIPCDHHSIFCNAKTFVGRTEFTTEIRKLFESFVQPISRTLRELA